MPRWGDRDTERIGELIELEGVIDVDDPAHLTNNYIEKVRSNHFKQFEKKNFRVQYRNKVRGYCLGEIELKGARKEKSKGNNSVMWINIILSLANVPFF